MLSAAFLPIIKFRPQIRIGVRPLLAMLFAELFLHGRQQLPVVPTMRLLGHADERRGLAGADIAAKADHFAQAAAKVVAAVAYIN